MPSYIQGAELGPTRLWLRDRGQLVDLSAGFTVTVAVVSKTDGTLKAISDPAQLTVGAGAGVEPHGTPNLQVNWEPDDLEIRPGAYLLEIEARDAQQRSYFWQVPFFIRPRYGS